MSIGKVILPQSTGRGVRVSADGQPEWKPIGVTVAWDNVVAANAPTTLADDTPVAVGEKAIEFGNIWALLTSGGNAGKYSPVDMSVLAAPAAAPTATHDSAAGGLPSSVTLKLGYTYTNAAGESIISPLQSVVMASGDTEIITNVITKPTGVTGVNWYLSDAAGSPTLRKVGANTGGALTISALPDSGKVVPPTASTLFANTDGRQVLTPGQCGINDVSIKFAELTVLGANLQNDLTGLIEGGVIWPLRLKVGNSGQPTLGQVLAAMPRLRLAPS